MAPSGPRLLPRDDAPRRPDFLAFRQRLRRAVARRDSDAVLAIADPDIVLDFAGGAGIDVLRSYMMDSSQDFWGEFGRALAMGGTFEPDGTFAAPYVFSAWPHEFDAYGCAAVTGNSVRLRNKPNARAQTIARLHYDIVEEIEDERPASGWTHVRLATGLTGYVPSSSVRSPIDYRAGFAVTDNGWRLKFFVAGD